MLFVERLRDRKRGLRGEAELVVGLALQAREVKELGREARRALAGFGHVSDLSAAALGNAPCGRLVKDALGLELGRLGVLFERGVEPAAFVRAVCKRKARLHLPELLRLERADLVFTPHDDRQGRRLHAADRCEEEAAVQAVEGRHGARAVDAHEPVGLRAALGGRCKVLHLLVAPQVRKGIPDGARRHGLQPEPLHGLFCLGGFHDVAEDQLALASRVACIDDETDVLAADELSEGLQFLGRLGDRLQVERRRQHRQVRKGPFTALHFILLGAGKLKQVPEGIGNDILFAFIVVGGLFHAAQHLGNIRCNRRLFRNDECFHLTQNIQKTRIR